MSSGALQQGGEADAARQHGPGGVTAVGCLKREADVPGLQRSVLERWGVVHDFVLVDVRMSSATPAAGDEKPAELLDAMKSVPQTNARYYVTGLGTKALEPLVNHLVALEGRVRDDRVGVTRGLEDTDTVTSETASHFEANGRTSKTGVLKVDSDTATARQKSSAPSRSGSAVSELPKLEATGIRGLAATCVSS